MVRLEEKNWYHFLNKNKIQDFFSSGKKLKQAKNISKKQMPSWTSKEEETLRHLVVDFKTKNPTVVIEKQNAPVWEQASKNKSLKGKTAAACLARWMTKVSDAKTEVTRGNWTNEEDDALVKMFSSAEFNSWSKRAIQLGKLFHKGVRRGGAETCSRYFELVKKKKETSAAKKKGSVEKEKVQQKKKEAKKEVPKKKKVGKK